MFITVSIGVTFGLAEENVVKTRHGCTKIVIRAALDVTQTVSIQSPDKLILNHQLNLI